jgi:phage baseplate assembly protein gpV
MVGLKIKKETIYLGILVFSLIGGVAIIQSCSKETGTGGEGATPVTDISSLPQSEQTEVLQIQDSSLGEVGLISDTELNPAIIEISLQEVDNILTARAPIFPKDEFSDEEAKTKQEIEKELSIKEIIKNFVSGEITQKFEKIEYKFKDADRLGEKYSSLLTKLLVSSLIYCKNQRKVESNCMAPQMSNCEIKILGCSLDDYSVSGTIYVSLQGDLSKKIFSYSVSVINVEFRRGDKNITFYGGQMSAKGVVDDLVAKTGSVKFEVSNLNISDTEEGVEISGTVKHEVQISSYGVSVTRTFENINYKKDGKTFTIESGKITAERKLGSPNITIKVENLKVKTDDNEQLTLNGSFKREVSKEPKFVLREVLSQISFSSSATSFSAEFYRFKKVQKEKTQDDKTFSLSITNYVKINGKVIRSYSHNLTIVKEGAGEFKVIGEIKIVKKDGTEMQIKLENVKVVKGCQNLTSGTISADVKKDGKVVKVNATLSQTCSCEHEVEVEKDGKLIKSKGNICEAKKKAGKETMDDMMEEGKSMGMMDGSHHQNMM